MEASELLNRITKAKRSQYRLRNYVRKKEPILGAQIEGCGSWLHFREWIEESETRLINANFCKRHLLCQACAVRRAGRMNEAYLPKVEQVTSQRKGLISAMITLTVKNGPNLRERVKHLNDSYKRMTAASRKAASAKERHNSIEWNKVVGSIRATEVTMSKDGEWHPHYHLFVLLDQYVSHPKFSAEWLRFTGDSKIVGIVQCRNGFSGGLREVLKYSCKFSSMNAPQMYEVYSTLKGKRLIDPQGILRGVREPNIDQDSTEGLKGPYHDFVASWIIDQQRYHISQRSDGPLRYHHRPLQTLKRESETIDDCRPGSASIPF